MTVVVTLLIAGCALCRNSGFVVQFDVIDAD